jgi:tRNA nucleotidyltransferase (CCA-adding enzyme)
MKYDVKPVLELACEFRDAGGRALIVGGSVRDALLGKISKDADIEVYGLPPEQIAEICTCFGKVSEAGKAFGVLKMRFEDDIEVDISLPRKDSKTGPGHRGFFIETDPFMSVEEAARRRDFTINSMAMDPLTGEIFDPYGGRKDLLEKILRVVDPVLFRDDPLRVLRGIQFIGRFDLEPDKSTKSIMCELLPFLDELPKERIGEEWKKLLLKSERPSSGMKYAMDLGILARLHPEFTLLPGTLQDPVWHPEGDIWVHTMMVLDAAAKIIRGEDCTPDEAWAVMLAALCHDLGKPAVTVVKESRIISIGHEEAGKNPTTTFLESIGVSNLIRDKVLGLVMEHMWPLILLPGKSEKAVKVSDGALRRLSKRLFPATIRELVFLFDADRLGRGATDDYISFSRSGAGSVLSEEGRWLLERARMLDIHISCPADIIMGRDLINRGFKQGLTIGKVIKLANTLRDEKDMTREELLKIIEGSDTPEKTIILLESILKEER